MVEFINNLWASNSQFVIGWSVKLAGAILTLLIGLWIIGRVMKLVTYVMEKREIDASLRPFLVSLLKRVLQILLMITVVDMVGIEVTSFIAILGAAGLAVGMALSGTLQNFAGGVMILIFRPYQVGDVIEAQGYIGSVKEIQIFNTILNTWDNKVIIIPNAKLANDSLTNYSKEPERKIEWVFGIAYNADIDKAKSIIEKVVFSDERVLDKEDYFINISNLGDSSVDIKVRVLVKGEDYWSVFFKMNEAVKKAFDAEGIGIPFPTRTVELINKN